MKGIVGQTVWAAMNNGAIDAISSDLELVEVDTGGAQNGTLILVCNFAASSDIKNLEVWTSTNSDFMTDGTQITAVASDGTRQVALASDASNFTAKLLTGNGDLNSDVTITSNVVMTLNEDAVYVLNLKSLSRYMNVQYSQGGAASTLTAVFIGHDLPEAPYTGAQSGY
ncbi:MAG TPA: hypothetical protein VM487_04255 [Phycisphaerae bacterium]|nr:hypothetical protein [Phycisphaerae bacterium]